MISPSERIVKLVAGTEPKRTPVAGRNPVPKIVTCVPPVVGPPAEVSGFGTDPPWPPLTKGGNGVSSPITLRPGPDGLLAEVLNVN